MIEGYPEIPKNNSELKASPQIPDWAAMRESWNWDDVWDES